MGGKTQKRARTAKKAGPGSKPEAPRSSEKIKRRKPQRLPPSIPVISSFRKNNGVYVNYEGQEIKVSEETAVVFSNQAALRNAVDRLSAMVRETHARLITVEIEIQRNGKQPNLAMHKGAYTMLMCVNARFFKYAVCVHHEEFFDCLFE
jgi:hypothetical protein